MRIDLVVAPNPGVMTGPGTNTWIIESGGESVVIDPGPIIPGHLDRVRSALAGSAPVGVVVTHSHPDHAPAANPLAKELGVPTIARSDGPRFTCERVVSDGDQIAVGDHVLAVVATPGHTADSTCYRLDDVLFTGDHIMGGSTVVVEDMSHYMMSLERVAGSGLRRLYPGHDPIVEDPEGLIQSYLEHRRSRESQVHRAVEGGASTVGAIVEVVYRDVDPVLHPVAAVTVAAHLRKLASEGRVGFDGTRAHPWTPGR